MEIFPNHTSRQTSMPSRSSSRSIQDQILEVTVLAGCRLKNTAWIGKQDTFVVVKYSDKKYRTETCKGGGTNPVFNLGKFKFKLVEGIREIKVKVYNKNVLAAHDCIGKGEVDLEEVLSSGYQEYSCTLTNGDRNAGEIRLILRYPNEQVSLNRQQTLPNRPFQPQPPPQQPHTNYAHQPYPNIYPSPPNVYPHPPPNVYPHPPPNVSSPRRNLYPQPPYG